MDLYDGADGFGRADDWRAIFTKMDREGSVLTCEKHYFLIFSYHYRPL